MTRFLRTFVSVLLLSTALACGARPEAPASVGNRLLATDAANVYRFTSIPYGFETNSYVIEGTEGVAIIDGQFLPSEARVLAEAIDRELHKPILLVVVLHPNPDKFNGADVFRERGARVVSSSQVVAHIPEVDALRRRWFYERYQPDYPEHMPTVESFGDASTDLQAGDLTLRAHVLGKGCSDAHVVVQWNDVVFVGDLITHGNHAWLEFGYLGDWYQRLADIRAMNPTQVMIGRGHSSEMHLGRGLIEAQQNYLDFVFNTSVEELRNETMRGSRIALNHVQSEAMQTRIFDRIKAQYPGYGYEIFVRLGMPRVVATAAEEMGKGIGSAEEFRTRLWESR